MLIEAMCKEKTAFEHRLMQSRWDPILMGKIVNLTSVRTWQRRWEAKPIQSSKFDGTSQFRNSAYAVDSMLESSVGEERSIADRRSRAIVEGRSETTRY